VSATRALDAWCRHERARIDLSFHEASHCVAGVLNGGVLESATVIDGKRGKSGVVSVPRGETTFAGGTLPKTRHAMVAAAGPFGEGRGRLGRRPNAVELRRLLDGGSCRDREVLVAAGGSHSGDEVMPLLERCWGAVESVAGLLHRTGKASHSDVLRALSLSDDAATRQLEVALIRSGAAPGSFKVSRPS
jgi:hypothetical protein